MLDAKAREALKGFYEWTGRTLARAGFTADSLTVLGIVLTAVAAWRITGGAFRSAGIILTAGGVLDFCDGAVAKARGTASELGAFWDSVSDRLSDALVFGALIWFYFGHANRAGLGAALLALIFAQLTSYIRAKAEGLGFDCKVGILERAERLILICTGMILGFIEPMLWAVSALGFITVVQRIVHVARQARARV
jgi:CDP-diacylglycerol--glycerol-3-phosphate 3-phosphatidyltransferase